MPRYPTVQPRQAQTGKAVAAAMTLGKDNPLRNTSIRRGFCGVAGNWPGISLKKVLTIVND